MQTTASRVQSSRGPRGYGWMTFMSQNKMDPCKHTENGKLGDGWVLKQKVSLIWLKYNKKFKKKINSRSETWQDCKKKHLARKHKEQSQLHQEQNRLTDKERGKKDRVKYTRM